MKLSYTLRTIVTVLAIGLAAYFWSTDGVDRGLAQQLTQRFESCFVFGFFRQIVQLIWIVEYVI